MRLIATHMLGFEHAQGVGMRFYMFCECSRWCLRIHLNTLVGRSHASTLCVLEPYLNMYVAISLIICVALSIQTYWIVNGAPFSR